MEPRPLFKLLAPLFLLFLLSGVLRGSRLLIPMDQAQKDHLKSYGVAYWVLQRGVEVEWLLNYRGGSFMMKNIPQIQEECRVRGVSFEIVADAKVGKIKRKIGDPEVNKKVVKLQKVPKLAVYSPKSKDPWDDAVTLALTYAEIPYDVVYDKEVMKGKLPTYDWLHLHHEDFTGQFGKFYRNYRHTSWYQEKVKRNRKMAKELGFSKVSELKLGVALKIREYTAGGGFLFTMCSGTDTYDIALSAHKTDICKQMFDGDPADPAARSKIDYDKTIAFEDFKVNLDPMQYEFSSIDASRKHNRLPKSQDKFTLFDFSAKWDIVPTILTQNHTDVVDGFMGQTTAFKKKYIKPDVLIMGETKALNSAKYIHGTLGKGQWTFYGGHDPEDYKHYVGDPPTDLNLHPNSPGYRLILNNILFPAAKKKERKT
ncbi:MAG: asparagine synthetase B [Flavobacteriales bacterium]